MEWRVFFPLAARSYTRTSRGDEVLSPTSDVFSKNGAVPPEGYTISLRFSSRAVFWSSLFFLLLWCTGDPIHGAAVFVSGKIGRIGKLFSLTALLSSFAAPCRLLRGVMGGNCCGTQSS